MTVLEPHALARQAARRHDEQLVTLVAQALEPWPVRVFVLDDRPGVLRIVLGRPNGAYLDVPVDPEQVRRHGPAEVALIVAREARRRWHALEPLPVPANVTLGQE